MNTTKQHGWLSFTAVREAFKSQGRFVHPLNCPVDTIETICLNAKYIAHNEHLGPYNTEKESFPIITFNDDDRITVANNFRTKLARFILPK